MTAEEYKAWNAKKQAKIPKFRNKKKIVNGLEFDSTKEARRYQDLVLMQSAGRISKLTRQTEYELKVNGILICIYVADFSYVQFVPGPDAGKGWIGVYHGHVVEDVKSKATRKLPVYAIKKKLMKAIHGIEIQEV
jgi:hypothetical protein